MKVLKWATNDIAILCHVTNYQQLTVGLRERQSVDSENSCYSNSESF